VTFVRAGGLLADDGITIPVPILLEGEESVVEFIDLPYSGVSLSVSVFYTNDKKYANTMARRSEKVIRGGRCVSKDEEK